MATRHTTPCCFGGSAATAATAVFEAYPSASSLGNEPPTYGYLSPWNDRTQQQHEGILSCRPSRLVPRCQRRYTVDTPKSRLACSTRPPTSSCSLAKLTFDSLECFARHHITDVLTRRGGGGISEQPLLLSPFSIYHHRRNSTSRAEQALLHLLVGGSDGKRSLYTRASEDSNPHDEPPRIVRISSSSLAASVMNDPWRARSFRRLSTSFLACGSLSAADLGWSSLMV